MKMDFGGVEEEVVTRGEFPLEKAGEVLKDEVIAVIGYGVQGPAQSQNMRDNGLNVIVGQSDAPQHKEYWDKAVADGWVPGETLFSIEEAAERGTIIQYLVSDAGQKALWPTLKPHLEEGDALYFSHGFSIVFNDQTGVVPPENIDVILVAPKGAGRSVRDNYVEGRGINSSYAVHQDATGRALERTLAVGIGIGSGYLFETTFENEVLSDLTGERGILLGGLWGLAEAQYAVLRARGHSPSEAFNETVEELTQSLIPLMSKKGIDFLLANCSTTAQRGALDWGPKFKAANQPLLEELYDRVADGSETRRVLEANSEPNYMEGLKAELAAIRNSEMWKAGAAVRSLRPENQ